MINKPYDCREDVMKHKEMVEYWLNGFATRLKHRAYTHDNSKLKEPEKSMFDEWIPNLKLVEFGSDEYKYALTQMEEGLRHHYEHNRHHPQHYGNGIDGMTIIDVVEMLSDWMASAQAKKTPIDLDYLAKRFNISDQLLNIIANTLREVDVRNEIEGVSVIYFTPENNRKGKVDGLEEYHSTNWPEGGE